MSSILMTPSITAAAKETGGLTGIVADRKTGEGLIGLSVSINDTKIGGLTDVNGEYRIKNIPAGVYTIKFTYMGYTPVVMNNVSIQPGETRKLDLVMEEESFMSDEVVVKARKVLNTEAGLLKERQRAAAVSDMISSEEFSKSSGGDAADAMKSVTGASTESGKYVFIRGLGDRYSSAQLNGSQLPSADPDKKSVHLDLFPTSLIDNIVTTKSATPDKPGDFTGGTVNITTKAFPDDFKFDFKVSSSYNDQTTGTNNFLALNNTQTEIFPFENNSKGIPQVLQQAINSTEGIPQISEAWTNPEKAYQLDRLSKAFNSNMVPERSTAPANHSLSLSVGNQTDLLKKPLGYLASLSYNRKFSSYNNGQLAFWSLPGNTDKNEKLSFENEVTDQKSIDEELLGGMLNLSYNLSPNHQISSNFMYSKSGEYLSRYQRGSDVYYTLDLEYETRVMKYTERMISSYQVSGKHNLGFISDSKADWQISFNKNTQNEPDVRFFTNDFHWDYDEESYIYDIDASLYKFPSRYFRDLSEDLVNADLNWEIPFKKSMDLDMKFKTGASFVAKERNFQEYRFDIAQDKAVYNGTDNAFFETQTGIIDSSGGFYRFGNYIQYYDPKAYSYSGEQSIFATYAMLDWWLMNDLRIIGGIRYESTDMHVQSFDSSKNSSNILENDFLPSVNMVYQLSENMNLRTSYGLTLARPNFREMAPYSSFNYVGGYIFKGNDSLQRSLINNFDMRWEWFMNPGEIVAVSGFYKDFSNPIERVIINVNREVQYRNVDRAILYGAEFEFRKNLGFLTKTLNNFNLGANLTLVHSEVDISPQELEVIKSYDPNASPTRELQGQSPYIVNLNVAYSDRDLGTDLNIHYYVFGKRLSEVTQQGSPDIYEHPRPELGIVFSQNIYGGLKLKVAGQNLLDSKVYKAQTFKGVDYVTQQYTLGRIFSVGVSYSID